MSDGQNQAFPPTITGKGGFYAGSVLDHRFGASDPYTLDLGRSPNKHLTFGSGPHLCVGSHLARLMLQLAFQELFADIECFELAGRPRHLVSNQLAGIVSLPVRVKRRTRQ